MDLTIASMFSRALSLDSAINYKGEDMEKERSEVDKLVMDEERNLMANNNYWLDNIVTDDRVPENMVGVPNTHGGIDLYPAKDWALRFESEFQANRQPQIDKEKAKLALEQEITRMIHDFTESTGAKVGYGSITFVEKEGRPAYSTRLELSV
jgi:hypothetical protein